MPEGDTVRRTADRLHLALAGRELVRTELRWPGLGEVDLSGREVLEVKTYGKHIITRIGAGDGSARFPTAPEVPLTLRSHLRMEGSWRIHATGPQAWPGRDQAAVRAVLAGTEWTAVGIWLGLLDLLPTTEEHTLFDHLGPDVLAADFLDPATDFGITEALRRLRAGGGRTIGEALLDQTNLAGIGTFYMAETLFLKGVSPWVPVEEVTDLAAMVTLASRMLTANLVRPMPTTTGISRPGQEQWVHARSGKPCRRCGTVVRVAMVGPPLRERTAFYCPSCQQGPTPTDDGAPMRPLGTSPRGLPGTGVSAQGRGGRPAYRRP
ncbi:Fpg/Nei family DNA glycosylase [Nakamurella silvestris]|nr:Fpg/Nei family DNA glycosylase [Nakamurella silvestris]